MLSPRSTFPGLSNDNEMLLHLYFFMLDYCKMCLRRTRMRTLFAALLVGVCLSVIGSAQNRQQPPQPLPFVNADVSEHLHKEIDRATDINDPARFIRDWIEITRNLGSRPLPSRLQTFISRKPTRPWGADQELYVTLMVIQALNERDNLISLHNRIDEKQKTIDKLQGAVKALCEYLDMKIRPQECKALNQP